LLASFPCKLNTFRKRVKNVTSKRIANGDWVYIGEVMWSVVMWSELTWLMWSDFILGWREVSYGEVLVDKGAMYIMVTLYWGYLILLWLFHLGISCTVFVLICTVVVLYCFVMCGCVCVCVCFAMHGCFGNMYIVPWLRFFLAFSSFFRQMPR
jgi:hypothetical protein